MNFLKLNSRLILSLVASLAIITPLGSFNSGVGNFPLAFAQDSGDSVGDDSSNGDNSDCCGGDNVDNVGDNSSNGDNNDCCGQPEEEDNHENPPDEGCQGDCEEEKEKQFACIPEKQNVEIDELAFFRVVGNERGGFTWTAPEGNPSFGSGRRFSTFYTHFGHFVVTVTNGKKTDTCEVKVKKVITPTPSPSPSPSPTPSLSPSPSPSPSVSPSPSLTPSVSPSHSPTPSLSVTVSPSPSVSPSLSPSPSPSLSPSISPSMSPSPAPQVTVIQQQQQQQVVIVNQPRVLGVSSIKQLPATGGDSGLLLTLLSLIPTGLITRKFH